jgi:hypothetical protein
VIGFTIAVVVAGIALALIVGVERGFDGTSGVIFLLIVAVGALGIAVARRARSGAVAPVRCRECGGLNSPTASICVHCGEALDR